MEQQPITVELDDELYRWLCERAAAANRSVGDFAGDLIEEALRKEARVAVRSQQATRGDFRYHINVFWYPDDDCWIADVPDLKPCSAHGDTPEEAVAEARIAIELWIETATERGISIPEPRYRPAIYAAA